MSDPLRRALGDDLARVAALVAGLPAVDADRPAADDLPIDRLVAVFGLTDFERDVLLLAAGMELDADCAAAVAERQGEPRMSFSLALAQLPGAHWSALLPSSPLRHWQLLGVAAEPSLVGATLRIDERILHFLLGLSYLDPRFAGRVSVAESAPTLIRSHALLADRVAAIWRRAEEGEQPVPVVRLAFGDGDTAVAIAATAADHRPLLILDGRDLPEEIGDAETLLRLLDREALLTDAVLLARGDPDPGRARILDLLAERAVGPVIVSEPQPRLGEWPASGRSRVTLDVTRPPLADQAETWRLVLEEAGVDELPPLDRLAYQFDLGRPAIRSATLAALAETATDHTPLAEALWRGARVAARGAIDGGLERITPEATWSQLILPEREEITLKRIVAVVRDRAVVHGLWGFAGGGSGERRGLGLAALFAGPSGTGKTLAAEVLANDLDLDLYRIDLSKIVNKYIGETEKNLARVFDAAEAGGAILLFDEADALFGKRSEVKDSHDRHANIEVSYLLSRIEAYSGIAILTTNLKDSIDQAFLRRMRFVVNFPFPDPKQRADIWRSSFPAGVPLNASVDFSLLGQLDVTGGVIRNIARNAANYAHHRHRGEREAGLASTATLTLGDIRAAAIDDYRKNGRTLTATETRGWG